MAKDSDTGPHSFKLHKSTASYNWFKHHRITSIVLGVIAFFVIFTTIAITTADNHADKLKNAASNNTTGSTSNGTIPYLSGTQGTNNSSSDNTSQPPACTSYQTLDSQTWLEIVKDPDSHKGDCITVYGDVTQFDAATGNNGFRANVGGVQQTPEYGYVNYPTNTTLVGDASTLTNVVQQDLFTANVMVLGSYSYDTQIGGQTTVPQLQVISINVTGTLSN